MPFCKKSVEFLFEAHISVFKCSSLQQQCHQHRTPQVKDVQWSYALRCNNVTPLLKMFNNQCNTQVSEENCYFWIANMVVPWYTDTGNVQHCMKHGLMAPLCVSHYIIIGTKFVHEIDSGFCLITMDYNFWLVCFVVKEMYTCNHNLIFIPFWNKRN